MTASGEAGVARDLAFRHTQDPHKRVYGVEHQFRIPLIVNDVKVAEYRCDLSVVNAVGGKEQLEAKGYWTDAAKLKRKLFPRRTTVAWLPSRSSRAGSASVSEGLVAFNRAEAEFGHARAERSA